MKKADKGKGREKKWLLLNSNLGGVLSEAQCVLASYEQTPINHGRKGELPVYKEMGFFQTYQ